MSNMVSNMLIFNKSFHHRTLDEYELKYSLMQTITDTGFPCNAVFI